MTLNWLPAQGLPTIYEVQISEDSTFQSGTIIRAAANTSLSLNGLSANTLYYYRIRASNQQGFSSLSSTASQRTKDKQYPFLISKIPDQEMRNPIFARRQSNAEYYTYTQRSKISTLVADSLVQLIVNQNLAVDSLWFQDTVTKFSYSVNSMFIAKAKREDTRLINLGFLLGNRPPTLDLTGCEGGQFYLYHSLTPVSVKQETSEQNKALSFSLYPNPATTEIAVQADLPYIGTVSAEIVDILGRRINTSSEQIYASGTHELTFSTRNFANGTYILRIKVLNQASGIASYYSRQFTVMR